MVTIHIHVHLIFTYSLLVKLLEKNLLLSMVLSYGIVCQMYINKLMILNCLTVMNWLIDKYSVV